MNLKIDFIRRAKPLLQKFFGIPLTLLSFIFIGKVIFDNLPKITSGVGSINPLLFIPGILLLMLYFPIRGIIWNKLLKSENHDIPLIDSMYFLSLSEVKRYTPGNIFSFIARAFHFEKIGIPKKTTATLLGIEVFFVVVASAIVSLPSINIIGKALESLNIHFIKIPTILFFLLIIGAGIFLIYKKGNKKSAYEYINILLLTILSWVVFGIGNFFIASSFASLSGRAFLELSSFFIFSWLIGYLTLITPMGLGVREAVVIFGLTPLIGLPLASTVAIMLRLTFISAELLTLSVLYIFKKNNAIKVLDKFKLFNIQTVALALCIIAFISYFSFFAIEKHNNFFTGRYDLGNMDQTAWNTINGRIFLFTNPDVELEMSRLGAHADFILIFISPLYFIWSDPRMLLILQVVIVALGAVFVYLISKNVLKKTTISLLLGVSYLLNIFVQKQILFDFHAVTLATTFLLAGWFFLEKKKVKLFVLFLILASLTKENVWVTTGLLGLYSYFIKKEKIGIAISLVSFGMFYLLVSYFIPAARGGDHFALVYYKELGDSPLDIIKSLLTQPQLFFQKVFSTDSLEYLKVMFVPVGFLSLAAPQYLLLAVSDFAINLLSNNKNFRSIDFHYGATIIPFIYIASIYGIKNIIKKLKINPDIIVYFLIGILVYSTYYYSVLPGTKKAAYEIFERKLSYADLIHNSIKKIPHNATVAATNNLGPHLTHRRNIFTVPNGIEESEYVVFLLTDTYVSSLSAQRELAATLKSSGDNIIIAEEQDFILLKKKQN